MSPVSVLIPTYNRAHMIERAVESARCQSFAPREIVIVDDGSTDDTHLVVEGLRKTDPRIRAVYQECNRGVAATRNRCLAEAQGEFVAFLDSDDTWRQGHLESCLAFFKVAADLDVVFADIQCVAADDRLIFPKLLWETMRIDRFLTKAPEGSERYRFRVLEEDAFLRDFLIRIQAAVVRRTAALQFPFDESLRIGEDWDFFLRMARAGKRFGFINQIHCSMLIHEGNLVANGQNTIRESEEVSKVWLKLLNDPTVTPSQQWIVRGQLGKLRFDEGYAYYRKGNRREAVRAYWSSLRARLSYRTVKALVLAACLPAWVVQRRHPEIFPRL
jgi:glycosyltransferase involved in cell wall biosynthesis